MPTKMSTDKVAETLTPLVTRVAKTRSYAHTQRPRSTRPRPSTPRSRPTARARPRRQQGHDRRGREGRGRAQGGSRPADRQAEARRATSSRKLPDRRRDRRRRGDRASRRCCASTRTSSTTSPEMSDVTREAAEVAIDVLLQEQREFPPSPEFVAQAVVSDPDVYERPSATSTAFWLDRTTIAVEWATAADRGARVGPAALHLVRRRRLNVCSTASTGTSPRAAATRSPTTSSPSRTARRIGRSRTPSCWTTCAGSPTPCAGSGSARATWSGSTWAWCPSCQSRCWPARGSGAPHVVVFGGFSAEALGERLESTGAKLLVTQDEAWRKGGRRRAQGDRRRGGQAGSDGREHDRAAAHRRRRAHAGRPRPLVARLRRRPARPCRAGAVEAEHMLFALHTSGTTAKPKAVVHTSGGYLTYVAVTHKLDLRHPRRRRVLVRRRHRLGDRPQLHRLRAARQRHDRRPLRGRPDVPRPRAALGDHRDATA